LSMKAPAMAAEGRIDGRRVSLRSLHEADLAIIDAWYEEAARAAFEEREVEELGCQGVESAGLLAILRADEDEPIGLLEYKVNEGWMAVRFIGLAKAHRGWGYGSEAVRLLEEWALRERIAQRFRAEVDVRNGLGLYFWLRLGYRPAGLGELGSHDEGEAARMAMVRMVAGPGESAPGFRPRPQIPSRRCEIPRASVVVAQDDG